MTRSVTLILAALALAFAPMLALAASVGDVANPIIDRVQGEIVIWIAGGVVSAVMGVAGWFGSLVGIRVVEKLNRDTLREAAERYANGLIDLAQARYLDANPGAIADLVAGGIDYIKTGNPGTVKQTRIKDDRVGAYVTEAIQKVTADRLSSALGRALTQGVAAVSGS